jgi:hypothetical protein
MTQDSRHPLREGKMRRHFILDPITPPGISTPLATFCLYIQATMTQLEWHEALNIEHFSGDTFHELPAPSQS